MASKGLTVIPTVLNTYQD